MSKLTYEQLRQIVQHSFNVCYPRSTDLVLIDYGVENVRFYLLEPTGLGVSFSNYVFIQIVDYYLDLGLGHVEYQKIIDYHQTCKVLTDGHTDFVTNIIIPDESEILRSLLWFRSLGIGFQAK